MGSNELTIHLKAVAQGLWRAQTSIEIWKTYQTTSDTWWIEVMNHFNEFLVRDMRTHMGNSVVSLGLVYDKDKRSEGFARTWYLAGKLGYDCHFIRSGRQKIEEVEPIAERLRKARNKVFAHYDSSKSPEQVLSELKLTVSEMEQLLEQGFSALNIMEKCQGLPITMSGAGRAERHLRELLESAARGHDGLRRFLPA